MAEQLVHNDTILSAIEQAYTELGNGHIQPMRVFNTLARNGFINISGEVTDISEWPSIPDSTFLGMRTIGPETIKYIRRTIDILNGAEPLSPQLFSVTMTLEELTLLRRIYERKQSEITLLKKNH